MSQHANDLISLAPLVSVAILACIVLCMEAFVKRSERLSFQTSIIGLIVCFGIAMYTLDWSGTAFNAMVTVGGFGSFFTALFIVSTVLTIILSRDYLRSAGAHFGEFYLMLLFALIGMITIAISADLIVLFLGFELMSICLYVLAGFVRRRILSNESSLKYFLLGAFATGFLVYGIALIYGATGTTNITSLVHNSGAYSSSNLYWLGVGLFLVGLVFKIGAVPFHMWIPDVYQGSATPVSGFMSTAAKAAAFSAVMLVFAQHASLGSQLRDILAIIAAASMIVGNVIAVAQSNIKRMLAYSSIAHAGYMLVGLAAGNALGRHGVAFYLVSYMFMSIGSFGLLSIFEREGEQNLSFDDYSGLASKRPFMAVLFLVFMVSLAGLPPTAGFFGKYYVFVAAIEANLTWLVIIGVLTSVVSVYYYLRLVMVIYFREPKGEFHTSQSYLAIATLAIAALLVLQLGILPSLLLPFVQSVL
jgi:NADH-quinone oxidoreductase subunit N